MSQQQRTRRIWLSLAFYVLFAFIPGLHACLHPLVAASPGGPSGTLVQISPGCPDGCENPQHRHLSPAHECPVCKTGFSPNALPQDTARGLPLCVTGQPAVRVGPGLQRAPDIRIEHARAPPRSILL